MEDPFYNPSTKEEFLHNKWVKSLFRWAGIYSFLGLVLVVAGITLLLVGKYGQGGCSVIAGLSAYYISYKNFKKAVYEHINGGRDE